MNKPLLEATIMILRPLVHILLRNGVAYGTLAELVKDVVVGYALANHGTPLARIIVDMGKDRLYEPGAGTWRGGRWAERPLVSGCRVVRDADRAEAFPRRL